MIRTAELSHVGYLLTCGGTKPCLAGSDVGHGLLVALLVAFPVAWMTEVVVVGLLASHVKLAVVLSFVNSWFLGWPLSRVALLVGKLDQCHCVDGEDDVGVDAVNLDFCE